ncbi:FBD and LRR domain-containing protein [Dorcoceras hygrometricum]|uniref:FBD and LRR domain-containing protein n=1 Tax=Dorcoceras hygrometricum TaxID=472368 RepID=A0A2Z7C8W7_9LAMI|nr:FBD and LRR domain-containing protein [Dorcoceras hygrometricum]
MAGDPPIGPPPGPVGSNGTNHGPNRGSQCTREGHKYGCSPCAAHQVIFTCSHGFCSNQPTFQYLKATIKPLMITPKPLEHPWTEVSKIWIENHVRKWGACMIRK